MQKYTVIIDDAKDIFWYKEGTDILHRLDGPAIEYFKGGKYWYKEGKLHREDGPAFESISGHKEWYLEGKFYAEAKFNELIQNNIPKPTLDGKEVIIEGKTYKFTLVDK